MTASLVGPAGPDQRPASGPRRGSAEGRLGPLLNQQPTATIPPTPSPTSAVRGWPHWWCVLDLADFFEGDSTTCDLGEDGLCGCCPHVRFGVVVVGVDVFLVRIDEVGHGVEDPAPQRF